MPMVAKAFPLRQNFAGDAVKSRETGEKAATAA